MKLKTIKKVLKHKFDDFLESITDENVKKLVKENTIITGGCITSMLLKQPVNDFDIYFTNRETVLAVANYYVNLYKEKQENKDTRIWVLDGEKYNDEIEAIHKQTGLPLEECGYKGIKGVNMTRDRVKIIIESAGVTGETFNNEDDEEVEQAVESAKGFFEDLEDKDKPKYRPIFFSANAITLANKIQIVIRFYGEAEKVHETFDFVHTTNYWTSKNNELVINQKALEAIITGELVYFGSRYPIASVIRTKKFIGRGWTINAGQYLKMAMQISKLNLEDINVLEDQLVGVDTAYFSLLIDALKEKKKTDPDFKLDYNYIVEIINRIF